MTRRIDQLERAFGDDRYVALQLVLRERDCDVVGRFGGKWDRLEERFAGRSDACRVIDLNANQLEAVSFFITWQAKRQRGERREVIAFIGGARRGGKSYVSVALGLAFAVDHPGSIVAIVSPTFSKRDQLERQLKALVPSSWGEFHGMPAPGLRLANGSVIQFIGASDPTALKRGRLDCVILDDNQDMAIDSLVMALPAVIDSGGLVIVAANPPRRFKGEHVLHLRQAVLDGRVEDARVIDIDPAGNTEIDAGTRVSVGKILAAIDPKASKADDLGLWLPTGDRVYLEHLDPKRNLVAVPATGEITEEFARRRFSRAYARLGGCDFQSSPHNVAIIFRVYGTVDRPIYHAVDEVITPPIGSPSPDSTEEELLHDLEANGYGPERLAVVGDASGQQQDAKHTGPQRTSYSVFRSWRYKVVPPVEKRSEKGLWSKNPPIEDRINLVNKLLSEGRFLIDPKGCPWLAECMRECPLRTVDGRRKPYGKFTHASDAAAYFLFFAEPAPKAPAPSWPGGRVPFRTVDRPRGIRIL